MIKPTDMLVHLYTSLCFYCPLHGKLSIVHQKCLHNQTSSNLNCKIFRALCLDWALGSLKILFWVITPNSQRVEILYSLAVFTVVHYLLRQEIFAASDQRPLLQTTRHFLVVRAQFTTLWTCFALRCLGKITQRVIYGSILYRGYEISADAASLYIWWWCDVAKFYICTTPPFLLIDDMKNVNIKLSSIFQSHNG